VEYIPGGSLLQESAASYERDAIIQCWVYFRHFLGWIHNNPDVPYSIFSLPCSGIGSIVDNYEHLNILHYRETTF